MLENELWSWLSCWMSISNVENHNELLKNNRFLCIQLHAFRQIVKQMRYTEGENQTSDVASS